MKVLLRQDVRDLGAIGDIVEVTSGYARNYLFPRQLGVEPNSANLKRIEVERVERGKREKLRLERLKEVAAKLNGFSITMRDHRSAPGAYTRPPEARLEMIFPYTSGGVAR
jgi:large subunit ribosomal protein L9